MKSSNIKRISFQENTILTGEANTGTVKIEFIYGAIYVYKEVPLLLCNDFVKAENVDEFFHTNIKDNFKFIK